MADIPFSVLNLDQFIEHVLGRIEGERSLASPAFTLVLGSGFSVPLFPTAWKMVRDDIAWWRFSGKNGLTFTDYCPESHRSEFDQFSRELWQSVSTSVPAEIRCLMDAKSGLPDDSDGDNTTRAYQAIMSGQSGRGLNTADLRRDYFRALCKRVENRINLAHLYLGSLLHSQSTTEWKALKRRPICRTILTTNFDPLLQRALQLHNVLYFMTDQPHGGIAPPEDEDQAVHLIYTHGSVHRHHLANNPDEIAGLTTTNASALAGYLGRQGVIVVGYSGWNDTTFTAMQQCQDFRGNLYWCGRESAAQAAAGLRKEVRDLLSKNRNGRFYVELGSGGADALMQRLHQRLVGEAPAIVSNPTGLMIKELESIQWPAGGESMFAGIKGMAENQVRRLKALETPIQTEQVGKESVSQSFDTASLFVKADQAFLKHDYAEAIALSTEIVNQATISAKDRAQALIYRGVAKGRSEPPDKTGAIADYDLVLSIPDVQAEQRALALYNRGVAKGQLEPPDWFGAIDDWDLVLSMPDATAEQRAWALVNRGFAKGRLEPPDRVGAIADYDLVLSMPDATAEQRAKTLVNRGVAKGRLEPPDRVAEIADYDLVLSMPDAPAEQRAKALGNRGVAKGRLDPPDQVGEIADYDLVLSMPDAPAEQRARALANRGFAKGRLKPSDWVGAIADFDRVLSMPDAPTEQHTRTLFNLGCAYARLGDVSQTLHLLRLWSAEEKAATRTKLDIDADFDGVREDAEFKAFRDSLPE